MATAHAKLRPPSGASRWLSCPGSVIIHQLYPNASSEASLKGDAAHDLLETALVFGIVPDTDDPDMEENVLGVIEHIKQVRHDMGPDTVVYAERWYDIPETGEGGTADVTFVSPKKIRVGDYKNGYVPVDVNMNPQMLLYLLGAIAEFGERPKYEIEIYQPNYHHIDGPYRLYEVSQDDIAYIRKEIKYAVQYDTEFRAGKHCKRTYCPHRGGCATFHAWAKENLQHAYYPSDVNALTDEQLSEALEHAEILQGIRDEIRKEAMRRMINQGREVPGYKIVKGRTDREFYDDESEQKVRQRCLELGATDDDLFTKKMVSPAGIERFYKKLFKKFGRGKWRELFQQEVMAHVRSPAASLTLERAYDGRPAYKRGSEFDALKSKDIEVRLNSDSTPSLPRII